MTNKKITEQIYQKHHSRENREGFSYFETQRAKVLTKLIGKGKKIIDLGCRDGIFTRYFTKNNEVLGVDIDKKLLMKCHRNLGIKVQYYDLNSYTWPFNKNYYDVVVAGEILEHLYNPKQIVKKAKMLLKKNGMFIGSVPNSFHILDRIGFLFGKVPRGYADPTHVNMFSTTSLRQLLSQYFSKVVIIPVTVDKYSFLAKILPSFFADDLVFNAQNTFAS